MNGDELRKPDQTCGHGDIHDANRPAIRALLEQLIVDVLDLGILPGDMETVRKAILHADAQCDFVVTSGDVSVGDIFEQEGEI